MDSPQTLRANVNSNLFNERHARTRGAAAGANAEADRTGQPARSAAQKPLLAIGAFYDGLCNEREAWRRPLAWTVATLDATSFFKTTGANPVVAHPLGQEND